LTKSIAEQLSVPREKFESIIHEDLNIRKLSVKWVLKCQNEDKKRQRCQASEKFLDFFWRDPKDFLRRFMSMEETWLYHYDPETKHQSMEWWHSGSPRQKFPSQKSAGKVLARLHFLESRRHPPHWLAFKGTNFQRGVSLISAGAVEGHFEGKTQRGDH
jgi:hypothetical protein